MASVAPQKSGLHTPVTSQGVALLLVAFAGAIFTSAFLLFAVQPMFTKMVLPLLGGSPAVWSVAMVFFQTLLLAGYGYAHLMTRLLPLKPAVVLHLALFAATVVMLPFGIREGLGDPPASGQELWLIGVFLTSVGLPFFAVSANGPLLQAWFARTAHPTARDPYYLYGASNLGSFAALIAYPVVIEPLMTLKDQAAAWSAGFVMLGGLIALSGTAALVWPARVASGEAAARTAPKPAWAEKLVWIGLSLVPSGLLVAVTAHLSTDVAAAPFMWVLPLALYLATFIVVFRERLPFSLPVMERIVAALAGALVLMIFLGEPYLVLSIVLHLGFLTAATLVCHARLYQRRPPPEHLTGFYLYMSLGGVLGGLFCGLLAPNLFNGIAEYPILILAALACLPGVAGFGRDNWLYRALPWASALVLALAVKYAAMTSGETMLHYGLIIAIVLFAGAAMACNRSPALVMVLVAGTFVLMKDVSLSTHDELSVRSFFGVNKVQISHDGNFRRLTHGTTVHGTMLIREADGSPAPQRPRPNAYYYENSPMAQVVKLAQSRMPAGAALGVVGLGAGTLVCTGRATDRWTYYEIDQAVISIARDARYFRFLSECAPETRIVVGDARLTLAKEAEKFDALVIDAFASDAIPVHLLTQEAVAMYLGRLKPGGTLALHISNRHLELGSVVAALRQELGVHGMIRFDQVSPERYTATGEAGSLVAVLARDPEVLKPLEAQGWKPLQRTETTVWTDDYSNIIGAMWRAYAN